MPAGLADAAVRQRAQSEHQSLLKGYKRVGIVRKTEKSVVEEPEASVWGASLSSRTKTVQSSVQKRRTLVHATLM
eukprot:5805185-Amphidinium_carterae.1